MRYSLQFRWRFHLFVYFSIRTYSVQIEKLFMQQWSLSPRKKFVKCMQYAKCEKHKWEKLPWTVWIFFSCIVCNTFDEKMENHSNYYCWEAVLCWRWKVSWWILKSFKWTFNKLYFYFCPPFLHLALPLCANTFTYPSYNQMIFVTAVVSVSCTKNRKGMKVKFCRSFVDS